MAKNRRKGSFRLISIYEPYFDTKFLDLLSAFESPKFLGACTVLAYQLSKNLISPPIFPTDEMIDNLRKDVKTFIEMVEYCNKYSPDSANFYKNPTWWLHRVPTNS